MHISCKSCICNEQMWCNFAGCHVHDSCIAIRGPGIVATTCCLGCRGIEGQRSQRCRGKGLRWLLLDRSNSLLECNDEVPHVRTGVISEICLRRLCWSAKTRTIIRISLPPIRYFEKIQCQAWQTSTRNKAWNVRWPSVQEFDHDTHPKKIMSLPHIRCALPAKVSTVSLVFGYGPFAEFPQVLHLIFDDVCMGFRSWRGA